MKSKRKKRTYIITFELTDKYGDFKKYHRIGVEAFNKAEGIVLARDICQHDINLYYQGCTFKVFHVNYKRKVI